MASTQGNADSNTYYEIPGPGQEDNPPYIEVTGDAEYMTAIPSPFDRTVPTAPPVDGGRAPNIANEQLQGSSPPPPIQSGVYPQNQTTHQPQLQPQPLSYPPQHALPPQQQISPNQQYQPPPQAPATYPPPPPYQQYDQKAGLPPPYQPVAIQPQPVPYPNMASQQQQTVVVHQPQQQQQMQTVRAVVVTTRSNTGPTSSTYGIAITSIVLASIATCCLVGIFCTIPAIVFGALAMNSSTDTNKASSYAKVSMVLTGVAWGLYVILIVFAIVL